MENVNTDPVQTESAPVQEPSSDKGEPRSDPKVEAKPEAQSLRKSLEKNFKESADTTKTVDGTSSEPAQNKSFVNGANQQAPKATETIIPPASMTEEEKAAFRQASPALQKFLSRREYETRSHLTQATQSLSQKEKEASDILSVVTPEIRQKFTRDGIAIPDLIRRSIAWDERVKEGIDGALEFLEAHGYKAEQLANYKTQPEQPQYLTKEEALELAREEFKQQHELTQQSALAQEKATALMSFIDSKPIFKGDPGTAAQVENAVAEEIEYLQFKGYQASTAQLLETAYQRAIANNPALSSLRPQVQEPTAKREDINQQMERVRSAKAASRSANGSLGSGTPVHKSNNLRESLERNYAKS